MPSGSFPGPEPLFSQALYSRSLNYITTAYRDSLRFVGAIAVHIFTCSLFCSLDLVLVISWLDCRASSPSLASLGHCASTVTDHQTELSLLLNTASRMPAARQQGAATASPTLALRAPPHPQVLGRSPPAASASRPHSAASSRSCRHSGATPASCAPATRPRSPTCAPRGDTAAGQHRLIVGKA